MTANANLQLPPHKRALMVRLADAPRRIFRHWITRYRGRRLGRAQDPQEIFSLIQQLNFWGAAESVSGPGSTLAYTENLRQHLPTLFHQFAIKQVLDAPCGDFNWMRHVLATTNVHYIGGDIVPALVRQNTAAFATDRTRFHVFDITRDPFPAVDLWLCRDCLFHLPFSAIYEALENFAASSIPYALLTNHRDVGAASNQEIRAGEFRKLDLMAAPFNLPAAVSFRIPEGPVGQNTDHEMCLWSRGQIVAALPHFKASLAGLYC